MLHVQRVYQLADLTDINLGHNDRYSAGPGYDLLTGMGVPNSGFTKAWLEQSGSAGAMAWLEEDDNVGAKAWLEQNGNVSANAWRPSKIINVYHVVLTVITACMPAVDQRIRIT